LEEIPTDRVERVRGRDVVQYRGSILPLVDVATELGISTNEADGPLQVVVCTTGAGQVGLVVSAILDVVEHGSAASSPSSSLSVSADGRSAPPIAVVDGRITELLDVERLLARSELGAETRGVRRGEEAA
jgi:two-component system chemotaxis sensor kinase CheA